ncbi:PTS glucitol/sorbitol transporter subunit IIA [Streptomyces ipomoeae]|uniref:PTS glucitol/sorbitol transporter subunit IIA n=1 Tax=Streptomyces ipomoeae TaxID=103232 RepID=UPI0015F07BC0
MVHEPSVRLTGELRCGGRLWPAGRLIELVAVGDRATRNLRELGHVVVHMNAADTQVPPEAVYGRGTLTLPETGPRWPWPPTCPAGTAHDKAGRPPSHRRSAAVLV